MYNLRDASVQLGRPKCSVCGGAGVQSERHMNQLCSFRAAARVVGLEQVNFPKRYDARNCSKSGSGSGGVFEVERQDK